MNNKSQRLIWIDLEMTGLDIQRDVILEIATIITDSQLNIIAQGPNLALHQSESALAAMDQWNQDHHNASGLVERVRASDITEQVAEQQTIAFLREHVKEGASPMAGNSVHTDRKFLERYMPRLAHYFHYRHCDVSTVKELAKRWAPKLYGKFEKEGAHRALDDIKESIEELKYYRDCFFKLP